jgi:hypothetical protein
MASNSDTYFQRGQASEYLIARYALRCSPQTLARYAVEGSGPLFRRAGRTTVYAVSALDEWAQCRLSEPTRGGAQPGKILGAVTDSRHHASLPQKQTNVSNSEQI